MSDFIDEIFQTAESENSVQKNDPMASQRAEDESKFYQSQSSQNLNQEVASPQNPFYQQQPQYNQQFQVPQQNFQSGINPQYYQQGMQQGMQQYQVQEQFARPQQMVQQPQPDIFSIVEEVQAISQARKEHQGLYQAGFEPVIAQKVGQILDAAQAQNKMVNISTAIEMAVNDTYEKLRNLNLNNSSSEQVKQSSLDLGSRGIPKQKTNELFGKPVHEMSDDEFLEILRKVQQS